MSNDDPKVFDPDAPASPEELAEAKSLADALGDSKHPAIHELNDSILSTAALLKASQGLNQEQHVLDRLLSDFTPPRRSRRKWLWAALAPMAGLLLLWLALRSKQELAPSVLALPPPSSALLQAQAVAISDFTKQGQLLAVMNDYRQNYYRDLQARYSGGE